MNRPYLHGFNVFKGLMGSGKSYGAQLAVLRGWQAGVPVYSISTMYPPAKYKKLYTKIQAKDIWRIMNTDFLQHGRGHEVILFLDEGWVPLDSYEKKLDREIRIIIMSCRKNGVNVYVTAQRWGLINVNVRAVTDGIYAADSFGPFFRWKEYAINENSDSGELTEEPVSTHNFLNFWGWRWRKKKVFGMYDTYEKITEMYPADFVASPFESPRALARGDGSKAS